MYISVASQKGLFPRFIIDLIVRVVELNIEIVRGGILLKTFMYVFFPELVCKLIAVSELFHCQVPEIESCLYPEAVNALLPVSNP